MSLQAASARPLIWTPEINGKKSEGKTWYNWDCGTFLMNCTGGSDESRAQRGATGPLTLIMMLFPWQLESIHVVGFSGTVIDNSEIG